MRTIDVGIETEVSSEQLVVQIKKGSDKVKAQKRKGESRSNMEDQDSTLGRKIGGRSKDEEGGRGVRNKTQPDGIGTELGKTLTKGG